MGIQRPCCCYPFCKANPGVPIVGVFFCVVYFPRMLAGKNKQIQRSVFDIFKTTLLSNKTVTPEGARLTELINEPDGWRKFLPVVGPKTFTSSFSAAHGEFWDWYWQLTYKRRMRLPITSDILTFLAAWPRGGGKSSNIEWACITEGAMGIDGYVLYVSKTQSSANSHVSDIRKRLESDEVSRFFPDLAEPQIGRHGGQYGWRQDFLMTKGGWAIRPVGLDVAVRGLREGDLRPTMIVFDDVDDFKMSVAEVQNNLATISRSILPAGTKNTIHLVAQNLIAEHSAVNLIYTGKSDVLQDHVASMYPAFEDLEIGKEIDERTGKSTFIINKAVPTWDEMDLEAAKVYLNKVGLEAFMAEYQHDFSLDNTEKVIPEYDPAVHVITWSQFCDKFDCKEGTVPRHWQVGLGLDIGYTDEHLAAWTWIAVSAEDSPLPWSYFRYRGMTFTAKSLTDQVDAVMEKVRVPDRKEPGGYWDERTQYTVSVMSHEKAGERMELNRKFEFTFAECKFRSEDGIPQWRGLLRVDKRLPHPFHQDEQLPDGTWKLGRPNYFDVVADDELQVPRTDEGLAIHRAQVMSWKRKRVTIVSSGLTEAKPMKMDDDANDSTRMILAEEYLSATPLSSAQHHLRALREVVGDSRLVLTKGMSDYDGVLMRRQMELAEAKRREEEEYETIANVVRKCIKPPAFRKNRF